MEPWTPRTTLGPYLLLEPIGAGGMGEVWKARDTRLDRTVAIKRLKPPYLPVLRASSRWPALAPRLNLSETA